MNIKQYIEKISLNKNKVLRKYLTGSEYKLFLTEEDDDIQNIMKSNKKEFRSLLYRANYFLAVFVLVIAVLKITSFGPILLLFSFLLFVKPLAHLFALNNKMKKQNIYYYRKFYGK
jgi:hypothetical protein